MAQWNNWNTSFTHIKFFTRALDGHSCVDDFSRDRDILFTIFRDRSPLPVYAVLVGRYSISLADVLSAKSEFPEMNAIVAYGAWCGYTQEAKEYGWENNIGVFQATEFLKALCARDLLNYSEKNVHGEPLYYYKSATRG